MKEKTKKWLYVLEEGCGRGAVACTVCAIGFFVAGLVLNLVRDAEQKKEILALVSEI